MFGISRMALLLFVLAASFCLAASCGGSGKIPVASPSLADLSETNSIDIDSEPEFVIETLDYGNPDPSQQGRLAASVCGTVNGGNIQVAVDVTDAVGFKSALLHLHYDSARYTPVRVTQGGFLKDALFLGVTTVPDIVAIGAVLPDPLNREGENGNGRIAVIEFAPQPFGIARNASAVPMNEDNRIGFASVLDDPANMEVTIIFTEKNVGDYDLSENVAVADITPIALRYTQETVTGNPADDPVAVVDGDENGQVGISDITPIAMNYLNVVEAYDIRWGIETVEKGISSIENKGSLPNKAEPGAAYSASRNYAGDELKPRYAYTFDYGAEPDYDGENAAELRFWIRPYGEGEFGIEGGPFSTSGGPPDDTTPPTWMSGYGVISAEYDEDDTYVDITFGQASDAKSAPVVYVAYWQTGETLDYDLALAGGHFVILDISGQTETPYTATLTTDDGLIIGGTISVGVHARDSALPFNETEPVVPHPFNPDGLDWIVVEPHEPPVDSPPVWQAIMGISEANPGNTRVTVGWGNAYHPEGQPSFEVYWLEGDYAEDGATFFATANHVNVPSGFEYTIEDLTNDELYSFGVRAKSPLGLEEDNTRVLTATPQESVYPFKTPVEDDDYELGVYSNDSDIVLTPIDNAPVIVYTRGGAKAMGVCYYNGADWTHETVSTTGYFEHPSIEIVGETIVVSAFNRDTDAIEVYTGDTNAQSWVLTTVDTESLSGSPIAYCYTASMEYEPVSDTLGIVYNAGVNSTKSILKYAFRVGEGDWTTEVIQDGAGYEDAPGASFVFTPDGTPSVAYTFGDFHPDPYNLVYDTYVYYGTREGDEWSTDKIPGNWQASQSIFLTYNTQTDQPFIIFGRDRFIDLGVAEQPVIDAVIAWKDASGLWNDQVLEEGYAYWDGVYYYEVKMAGADPVIGFNKAGLGFLYYSFVDVDVRLDLETRTIRTMLTESTFNNTEWLYPHRLDEFGLGCSAINMAIDVSKARLTYQRIGLLTDPPPWNEFPSGMLIYHQLG